MKEKDALLDEVGQGKNGQELNTIVVRSIGQPHGFFDLDSRLAQKRQSVLREKEPWEPILGHLIREDARPHLKKEAETVKDVRKLMETGRIYHVPNLGRKTISKLRKELGPNPAPLPRHVLDEYSWDRITPVLHGKLVRELSPHVRTVRDVRHILRDHDLDILTENSIAILRETLKIMEQAKEKALKDDPTLQDTMDHILEFLDVPQREVIELRIRGLRLEAIGEELNITRERVRQIEKKAEIYAGTYFRDLIEPVIRTSVEKLSQVGMFIVEDTKRRMQLRFLLRGQGHEITDYGNYIIAKSGDTIKEWEDILRKEIQVPGMIKEKMIQKAKTLGFTLPDKDIATFIARTGLAPLLEETPKKLLSEIIRKQDAIYKKDLIAQFYRKSEKPVVRPFLRDLILTHPDIWPIGNKKVTHAGNLPISVAEINAVVEKIDALLKENPDYEGAHIKFLLKVLRKSEDIPKEILPVMVKKAIRIHPLPITTLKNSKLVVSCPSKRDMVPSREERITQCLKEAGQALTVFEISKRLKKCCTPPQSVASAIAKCSDVVCVGDKKTRGNPRIYAHINHTSVTKDNK